jgi:DNA polymerase III subunit delta'
MPVMAWDVIGHDWAVHLLRHDLQKGRLAHAYLFTGADAIGKRTLALQFAAALNCLQPPSPGDSCGHCRPCTLLPLLKHPDLYILQPEGAGENIPVDAARALSHALTMKPLEARYRIALMLDFHRAHSSAANALLKTLEEPPPSALLLLTAESADGLLPTIVSRCRVLSLRPAREVDVQQALIERRGLPAERAQSLARLSGGRIGWAFSQAEDTEADNTRRALFIQWRDLFRQTRAERFAVAQEIAADHARTAPVLRSWQAFTHDLLLHILSPQDPVSYIDFLSEYRVLAAWVSSQQARALLNAFRRAEEGLDRNANARLAVEAALLDVPILTAVQ